MAKSHMYLIAVTMLSMVVVAQCRELLQAASSEAVQGTNTTYDFVYSMDMVRNDQYLVFGMVKRDMDLIGSKGCGPNGEQCSCGTSQLMGSHPVTSRFMMRANAADGITLTCGMDVYFRDVNDPYDNNLHGCSCTFHIDMHMGVNTWTHNCTCLSDISWVVPQGAYQIQKSDTVAKK